MMPTLLELRKKLDDKKISSYELTKLYLDNIRKFNSQINSYITVCEDFCMQECKKAQHLIDENSASAMTGIPISIKDNICTKGIKTTCASKMLEDFVPFYNANVIDKLLAENAIILGKTNLCEFGIGDSSQNSYFNAVKNPYNTNCTTDGSQASVAANMTPVSLGTDASFCGVTNLQPTHKLVSKYGIISSSSLEQISVCAKNAQDTAYLLNSIANSNSLCLIDKPIDNLRIGLFANCLENISPIHSVIDYFKKNNAEIIDISLPSSKYAKSAYLAISSAEIATNLSKYDGLKYGYNNGNSSFDETLLNSRKDAFGKEVKKRILLGNYVLSEENFRKYYLTACKVRNQLKNEYNDIFNKCDIIISPVNSTENVAISSNLVGLPEISTTCGYDKNNLPIGFSITGKAFDEAKIISVADRFEKDFLRKEPDL